MHYKRKLKVANCYNAPEFEASATGDRTAVW